jgi:hypothetical protein
MIFQSDRRVILTTLINIPRKGYRTTAKNATQSR